jgi:hypothetical protein
VRDKIIQFMGFMTGLARWPILMAIAIALTASSVPARCQDTAPPADLVQLERLVGLRIAHARDEDLGPDERKSLLQAQQDDALGEQALQGRDYVKATSYFRQANGALDKISQ